MRLPVGSGKGARPEPRHNLVGAKQTERVVALNKSNRAVARSKSPRFHKSVIEGEVSAAAIYAPSRMAPTAPYAAFTRAGSWRGRPLVHRQWRHLMQHVEVFVSRSMTVEMEARKPLRQKFDPSRRV